MLVTMKVAEKATEDDGLGDDDCGDHGDVYADADGMLLRLRRRARRLQVPMPAATMAATMRLVLMMTVSYPNGNDKHDDADAADDYPEADDDGGATDYACDMPRNARCLMLRSERERAHAPNHTSTTKHGMLQTNIPPSAHNLTVNNASVCMQPLRRGICLL